MTKLCLHATTISLNGSGVLIRGASGSGKSSLALMVLETMGTGLGSEIIHAKLVSDDQTELTSHQGRLYASPPATLAGLLEVRGQGILSLDYVRDVPLVLIVDLQTASSIERLPDDNEAHTVLMGQKLPRIFIDAHRPAAASRLRVALLKAQKAQ